MTVPMVELECPIARLPQSWSTAPLWALASCNDEVLPESTDPESTIRYIEISDVNEIQGITDSTDVAFGNAPSRARRKVRQGDVILSTVRTYLRAVAAIDSEYAGSVVSTGFAVIRPRKLHAGFLRHVVASGFFIEEVIARSAGVSYPAINASDVMKLKVPVPPFEEQGRIAAFLDHETARIDELVHEQERLQGLIQEKRHALIVKLVTHGEDATGPLIESRVPWIPCVPNHWRTFKLSNSFRTVGSGTTPPSTDDRWYGGDTPWITTGELREKVILDTRKRVSDLAIEAFPTLRRYPAGSVVIAMYGATIGRVGILGTPATVNQACCVLAHPTTLNSEFVFYWLQAHRENIARLGVGGGQPNISQEIVSSLRIPAPSLEEQAAIVGHLRHRIQEFDDLLSVSQRAVDLLLERRSALISAAVTGQLDLRNWRPPEPEAIAEVA